MTRQYIGARYVPKFYDYEGSPEWRSGVGYEALTIVTRSGNSYTSKVPVPSSVGAPESNSDYWASTGIYNEQIEDYRTITQGVADDLATEITARQTADTSLANRVSAIEAKNVIKQTKILTFGDSFGNEQGEWSYLLANMLGLELSCYNVGGASYPFSSQITAAAADYPTATDKDKIALAVVYGGINNVTSSALTDATAIKNFISAFRAVFPNVKLYVGPMNMCDVNYTAYPYTYANAQLSITNIINDLKNYDADFILMKDSWCFNLGSNDYFSSDHLHPSSLGSKAIARSMYQFITGTYEPKFFIKAGADLPAGVTILDSCIATPEGLYTPNIQINPNQITSTQFEIAFPACGFFVQPYNALYDAILRGPDILESAKDICYVYSDNTYRQFFIRASLGEIDNLTDYYVINLPRHFVPFGYRGSAS